MPKRAAESPESPAKRTTPPEPGVGNDWMDFLKWMHVAGGFFFAALPMDIIRLIGNMLGKIHTDSIASKVAVVETMLHHPSKAVRDAFWSSTDIIDGIPVETLADIGYYRLAPNAKIVWDNILAACKSELICQKFISNGLGDKLCEPSGSIGNTTRFAIIAKMLKYTTGFIDHLDKVGFLPALIGNFGGMFSEEVAEAIWRIANAVPETSQYYPAEFWDDLFHQHHDRFSFTPSSVYRLTFLGNICMLLSIIKKRCKTWDRMKTSSFAIDLESIKKTILQCGMSVRDEICTTLVKFCDFEPTHAVVCDYDILTWVIQHAPPTDATMTMFAISGLPNKIPMEFVKSNRMCDYMNFCIDNPTRDGFASLFNFSKDHPVLIGRWLYYGNLAAKLSKFNYEAASPEMCEFVSRLMFCFYDSMYNSTHMIDIKTWDKICEASQCADAKREKAHVLKAVRRRLRTLDDGEPSAASGEDD